MIFQTMPCIARNSVVPPDTEFGYPRVLRIKFQSADLLEGILFRIPLDTNVIDGLFLQILQHLRTKRVRNLVLHVKFASELRQDVDRVVFLDIILVKILLVLAGWKDTVFCNIVAMAVCRLRILRHCNH